MGLALYRYHGLPYLGSWDHNFPGTVVIHALGIALFGNSMLGFRGIELIMQVAIVLSLYCLCRLWLNEGASLVACLLYALFYVHGPGQFMGQRDAFAILPLSWAFTAIVKAFRSKSSEKLLFSCAGVSFAFATSIRPTFAILAVLPFIILYDLRLAHSRVLLFYEFLGFGTIVALWVLPYALIHDGIRQVYLSTIRFNFEVYSHVPFHFHDISNRSLLVAAFLLWWGAIMIVHRRTERHFSQAPPSKQENTFIVASFASLLIGVIIMRRIASYHLLPFCAFVMPVIAAAIWDTKVRWGKRGTAAMTLLVIVLFAGLYPWNMVFGTEGRAIFCSSKPLAVRLTGNPIEEAVVAYILNNITDHDTVEVSAFFPDIRWQIDRPTATRFTTMTALLLRPSKGTYTNFQREWQAEYSARIEQVRPKFYIIQNAVDSADDILTKRDLMNLPGFGTFIEQAYNLDTTMGNYLIYRRK